MLRSESAREKMTMFYGEKYNSHLIAVSADIDLACKEGKPSVKYDFIDDAREEKVLYMLLAHHLRSGSLGYTVEVTNDGLTVSWL